MTPQQQAHEGAESAYRIAKAGHSLAAESLARSLMQLTDTAALSRSETIFACSALIAALMPGLKKDEAVILAITVGNLAIFVKNSLDALMASESKTSGAPE